MVATKQRFALLCVIATSAVVSGCVAVGGTVNKAPLPTDGQQLIDLKRALDDGAITPSEYDAMRARIINPPAQ